MRSCSGWRTLRKGASPTPRFAGGLDAGAFEHQDHRSTWRPRPVSDSARDEGALVGRQAQRLVLEVDEELAGDYVEELVLVVVLMPVELALEDADAQQAIVDSAEGAIEPGVVARSGDGVDLDVVEPAEKRGHLDVVLLGLGFHRATTSSGRGSLARMLCERPSRAA